MPSLIRLNFFTRKAYVAIPHSIPIFPISLTLILASLAALAVLHWQYVTWGGHQQKQNFRLNKLYYGWSDFGMFCGVVFGIWLLSLSYVIGKSLLQKCGRIFRLSLKLINKIVPEQFITRSLFEFKCLVKSDFQSLILLLTEFFRMSLLFEIFM